jgi:hypothetical protein
MSTAPRFPSPGSSRAEFPGFLGTIKALRLPAAHPAALRFLRLAVPGEPPFPFAHGLRPRPADLLQTIAEPSLGPQYTNGEGADDNDFRGSIAWLSGSPPTYHARVAPLTAQGWLPGAGQALPGGLGTRRAPTKCFQLTSCVLSSSSKLLGTIAVRGEITAARACGVGFVRNAVAAPSPLRYDSGAGRSDSRTPNKRSREFGNAFHCLIAGYDPTADTYGSYDEDTGCFTSMAGPSYEISGLIHTRKEIFHNGHPTDIQHH